MLTKICPSRADGGTLFSVRRVVFSVVLLGAVGCKASLNAEAQAGTSGASASADGEADFEGDAEAKLSEPLPSGKPESGRGSAAAAAHSDSGPVLLGARRDLAYQGNKQAVCSCLAVQLGQPSNPAFQWEKGPITIDPQRQIVVGLSSQGVACEAERGLGASYKGYVLSGNDVVVQVERAHEGRPVTSGAVIPRPVSGQVLVVSAEKGSPFGGTIGDPKQPCVLEMPADTPAIASVADPEASLVGAGEVPETDDEPAGGYGEQAEFVDALEADALEGDAEPQLPHTRDGFFLAIHPGGSYLILEQRGTDAQFTGLGFGLDALIGGSPTEGLALGGILGGSSFPTPRFEVQGARLSSDITWNLFHVGGFVDYYTDPASGLHLLGEIAYAHLSSSGTRGDPQAIRGLALAAGLGYDWWVSDNWSLGGLARFAFTPMSHEQRDANYWLLLPGLNFTATYH